MGQQRLLQGGHQLVRGATHPLQGGFPALRTFQDGLSVESEDVQTHCTDSWLSQSAIDAIDPYREVCKLFSIRCSFLHKSLQPDTFLKDPLLDFSQPRRIKNRTALGKVNLQRRERRDFTRDARCPEGRR